VFCGYLILKIISGQFFNKIQNQGTVDSSFLRGKKKNQNQRTIGSHHFRSIKEPTFS
jgi:hypothetical protein